MSPRKRLKESKGSDKIGPHDPLDEVPHEKRHVRMGGITAENNAAGVPSARTLKRLAIPAGFIIRIFS